MVKDNDPDSNEKIIDEEKAKELWLKAIKKKKTTKRKRLS